MPSPSAPVPHHRSSADAGGKGVHGEAGGLWQAEASGGGSAQADPAGLADGGEIVASGGIAVATG